MSWHTNLELVGFPAYGQTIHIQDRKATNTAAQVLAAGPGWRTLEFTHKIRDPKSLAILNTHQIALKKGEYAFRLAVAAALDATSESPMTLRVQEVDTPETLIPYMKIPIVGGTSNFYQDTTAAAFTLLVYEGEFEIDTDDLKVEFQAQVVEDKELGLPVNISGIEEHYKDLYIKRIGTGS